MQDIAGFGTLGFPRDRNSVTCDPGGTYVVQFIARLRREPRFG